MTKIKEILKSKLKPKEKVAILAETVKQKKISAKKPELRGFMAGNIKRNLVFTHA